LAGSITRYSKNALQDLGSALLRFAHPEGDEKTVEELEALIERIERSPARTSIKAPRIHDAAKRLGAERVLELVAKYDAGSPAQALADEFEIGISTVLRLVRSQGGNVRGHGVSDEVRAEARRLYESGLSVQKVADRLELTKTVALRTIQKSGAVMRPQKNKPR
jgi:DNA invertase Pin-like site-specific DNA recombinase